MAIGTQVVKAAVKQRRAMGNGEFDLVGLKRVVHMALQPAPLTGQMVGNPRRANFARLNGIIQRATRGSGIHQQVRAVNQKVVQALDAQTAQRIVNGAA